jgi:hypothetical protein
MTQPAPTPDPDLEGLNKLVGIWNVSGGRPRAGHLPVMEGGFFLIQHVDLQQDGMRHKGIEIIGHERAFGAPPSHDIRSRYYDNLGDTLDYVYEVEGDTLTIWGGERGSPAYYRGRFSADGDSCAGAWVYPGGGGYQSTMTRIG